MRDFDPSKVQGIGPHSYTSFPSDTLIGDDIEEIKPNFSNEIRPGALYSDEEPVEKVAEEEEEYTWEAPSEEWYDQEYEEISHRISNADLIQDRIDRLKGKFQETIVEKTAGSSLLEDPNANPINIMLELDTRWDTEWRDWEAETILATAEKEGVNIARANQDKIMALKVIYKQPDFFDSARVFEKVCVAFSGRIVDWAYVQEIPIHDIAATVALVTRFVMDVEFSDDVKAYVAASALRDGYILLPENLTFADIEFTQRLVEVLGDEALLMQEDVLNQTNKSSMSEEERSIQLLRYVRCSRHTAELVNQIKK